MVKLVILLLFTILTFVQATGWGKEQFFQYANIPGWNQYEFGYHRGNDKHFTSRFEKAHGWTFKTKVRWGDKNGWGEQYYDYNHKDDTKKGWGEQQKGWHKGHQQGAGSEHVKQISQPDFEQPIREQQYQQQYKPREEQYKMEQYPKYNRRQ